MNYIYTPLQDLLELEYGSLIFEILDKTHQFIKEMEFISYKKVKNEKVMDMISFCTRDCKNEIDKQLIFHKLIELFLAKFLFVENMEINANSINQFKKDFFGV